MKNKDVEIEIIFSLKEMAYAFVAGCLVCSLVFI